MGIQDWIKLGIGLIVVFAWILGNIKEQQKAKPVPPPLPPPRPNPDDPDGARAAHDLQDFLQDIRRKLNDPPLETQINDPEPIALIDEPARPAPPPVPVPTERPRRPKTKRPIPPERPVVRMPELQILRDERPPAPARVASPSSPKVRPAQIVMRQAAIVKRKANSPALNEIVAILKSPKGLATAALMREILSEPLCKRRRR